MPSWTDEEEDLVSCVRRKAQRSSLTEADLVNGGCHRADVVKRVRSLCDFYLCSFVCFSFLHVYNVL